MVNAEAVENQLKRLGFNTSSWYNRAEIHELPKILMPDEEIYECVNGYYEGGFALLVATNIRVLLIDKKWFNYLTVEDLRFDMINEIDYNHRLMGAHITISAGAKTLGFRSYNQPRLRKLISHVQHCMAESKKQQSQHQEGQSQHLERLNQQLQAYLLANYQSQQELHQRLREAQINGQRVDIPPQPAVKPAPELADYLYSQSLLRQYGSELQGAGQQVARTQNDEIPVPPPMPSAERSGAGAQSADLYAEGYQEVFGGQQNSRSADRQTPDYQRPAGYSAPGVEINPLRVAYAKLPMALRNRKFGRSSFRTRDQTTAANSTPAIVAPLQAQATRLFGKVTPRTT